MGTQTAAMSWFSTVSNTVLGVVDRFSGNNSTGVYGATAQPAKISVGTGDIATAIGIAAAAYLIYKLVK